MIDRTPCGRRRHSSTAALTRRFGVSPDVWIRFALIGRAPATASLWAAGRLRPGVSLTAANAERRLAGDAFLLGSSEAAGPQGHVRRCAVAGRRSCTKFVGSLFALMGAAAAPSTHQTCTNMANRCSPALEATERDAAYRVAIGASRGRIDRWYCREPVIRWPAAVRPGTRRRAFGRCWHHGT